MNGEGISDELRNALADRFYSWELVEFLGVDIHEIIDLLEQDILDNIEDVNELIGLKNDEPDEDEQ